MGHRNARLTPFGRQILVDRVLHGTPAAHVAEMMGVSRATAYKWVRRYREEGPQGLEDRASRAHRIRHALPAREVERILRARRRLGVGPHLLADELGRARSTIYGVLRRHGMNRLDAVDRPTRIPIRYCRERPGELLHIDVKKLGRIRPGGGHRIHGRGTRTGHHTRVGHDYLHVAVDDCSRVAFVQVHGNERGDTCAQFLIDAAAHFAELGVRIEAVMTDNAKNYTLHRGFKQTLADLGTRHLVTPPYRPQVNGKAERFIRTMLNEWAYKKLFRTNAHRLRALQPWVESYNRRRSHTALGGLSPMRVLSQQR